MSCRPLATRGGAHHGLRASVAVAGLRPGTPDGPDASFERYAPARAFDAVIYLDAISAIHPLGNAN